MEIQPLKHTIRKVLNFQIGGTDPGEKQAPSYVHMYYLQQSRIYTLISLWNCEEGQQLMASFYWELIMHQALLYEPDMY